jgi:drug/metabolite transporter (DMT)-like permease
MLFAAGLLWSIAMASGGWRSLDASAFGLLALSGVIGIFIGDTALFACMNRLGPRRSGVLFATHALFSAVFAWWFLGESLWGWALVGGGLLVAGVMLAILKGRRDDESHAWEQTRGRLAIGVALGLVAALCQSIATLMLKPLMASGIDAIAGSAMRMSTAFAAHLLLWLVWHRARGQQPMRWRDAAQVFGSAAIAMALGMTLILQAMKDGQAGLVAILSSVTPIVVLPLLWLVYRRRPAWGAWAGAVLAVVGTGLVLG